MTPQGGTDLKRIAGLRKQPGKNYRMLLESNRVVGTCDGKEAMKQVIYKILMTERYRYVIYSWNYGVELEDLFGMPAGYVCPELERRIAEALTQDDRIVEVKDFSFDTSRKGVVSATFTAVTDAGEISIQKEVKI